MHTKPTTILRLKQIAFRRSDRTILHDISWAIDRGQHWAILGANGAGKTTLLKIITGYEWASEGTVEVLDEVFGQCDVCKLRRAIGWVSSSLEHRLPRYNTALEIVVSGIDASIGLFREFDTLELDRARKALHSLDCSQLADQPFETLSQGEQQRVLIARMLINQPKLLILDEPCAGLDPATREHFLRDLGRLTHGNDAPGLILVTHHIEEIGPWISHVLVLKNGNVLTAGAKTQVLIGDILGEAFGCKCAVDTIADRYYLRLINTD